MAKNVSRAIALVMLFFGGSVLGATRLRKLEGRIHDGGSRHVLVIAINALGG